LYDARSALVILPTMAVR